MRCLRCLNGVELPDTSPEGRAAGKPPKPLIVKVDDKTRAFLEEFEETLGRSAVSPLPVYQARLTIPG
jgi:RNA-binding protein 25